MQTKKIILFLTSISLIALTGCQVKKDVSNVSQEPQKKISYFYNESDITLNKIGTKVPKMDVSPAKIIEDTSKYVATYLLEGDILKETGLSKNIITINSDGTFIELRVLDTGPSFHYYVDSSNQLQKKKAKNYALLSGYVVEENESIFLSYKNAVQNYNALNQEGKEKLSPLPLEYNYQTFDYTGYKSAVFQNDAFEFNLGNSEFLKAEKIDEVPKEMTVTPLEVNETLKKKKKQLANGDYELNHSNDMIQLFNRKFSDSEQIELVDIKKFNSFKTTDNESKKAVYGFSTTHKAEETDKKEETIYLYDGEKIYSSDNQEKLIFEEVEF
ncbi:hypothetical protein [Vagococcus carniphilus]|uniref:hypothetical protein n=1 Tax=Vagococcus carniphilus TaxID=218144 RepID=UPI003B591C64